VFVSCDKFLPLGDKSEGAVTHTKEFFFWKEWPQVTIFAGKKSLKVAIFRQLALARHQNIVGFQKISTFLCDL
jgi:hypothetical protein